MNGRNIAVSLLSILVVCCFAVQAAWATDEPFDPLRQITSSFPGSVKLNEKRRVMEFCPDETCDGFVASSDVSVATLKDFAYLYIYFFSEYLVYSQSGAATTKQETLQNACSQIPSILAARGEVAVKRHVVCCFTSAAMGRLSYSLFATMRGSAM